MKKSKAVKTARKKRTGPKIQFEKVPSKNLKIVVHNIRLTAKMQGVSFSAFMVRELTQKNAFQAVKFPRMADALICSKIAGVRTNTFLTKKLKIKLIPA